MMQCEVTDSSACVPLMKNDRLISFAGFHSTWQRFQGRELESIFRILTMSCPFTLTYYVVYCVCEGADECLLDCMHSNFIVIKLLCSVLKPDWRIHMREEN